MSSTKEEVLASIANRQRELSSQNSDIFLQKQREVYKEKKNKKGNNSSRCHDEDEIGEGISKEMQPLTSSVSAGPLTQLLPLGEEVSQEKGVSVIAPATTITSRSLSGISAQHAQTTSGIKVAITLQTPEQAESAHYFAVTAELKRNNRISELKPYSGDSELFAEEYQKLLALIRKDADRRNMCVGRLHERGRRSAWVADMLVIGYLNSDNILQSIVLYCNNEQYNIKMDHALSPRQANSYHSAGIYGELRTQTLAAPTLATLQLRKFQ